MPFGQVENHPYYLYLMFGSFREAIAPFVRASRASKKSAPARHRPPEADSGEAGGSVCG